MRIRIREVVLPLDATETDTFAAVAKRIRSSPSTLTDLCIVRRSIDARRRPIHSSHGKNKKEKKESHRHRAPCIVLTVECEVPRAVGMRALHLPHIERCTTSWEPSPPLLPFPIPATVSSTVPRPVVVGGGPAGLFATLTLAAAGLRPILIERGKPVSERQRDVGAFWGKGILDPESHVFFGEGGAGMFSDGKLTSRSKDTRRRQAVLATLVRCGADPSILIDSEPHLGSDGLAKILPRLRAEIESKGGEIRFRTRMKDLVVGEKGIEAIQLENEILETRIAILATGQSAREIYSLLEAKGVALVPKAFAIGVRLELPQSAIDRAQWGEWAGHPRLGAAPLKATCSAELAGRACYTFCPCPGGRVVACASSAGEVLTNGMSLSPRRGYWGNAAFVVSVEPQDIVDTIDGSFALRGLRFQQEIEQRAFVRGGGDYTVPASPLLDFLTSRSPTALPESRSCLRARSVDLHEILPGWIATTLIRAIPLILGRMEGIRLEEAILYAPETRTSSPVRILRDPETLQVPSIRGLYAIGDGAGYAGGIVSAAIDGIRAAEAILQHWTR